MATNNAAQITTAAAGKFLQGAGVGVASTFSTPTYPSTSGSSRKVLVSDGTNNGYSTETWAVPGSSGNLLTSDATNWTSAAPAAGGTSSILLFTSGSSGSSTPADATNYYLTRVTGVWVTTNTVQSRVYIAKAGTITKIYGNVGTASGGSSETTTINVRLNNTTNTAIATISFGGPTLAFSNTGLSIAVSVGDYIQFYIAAQTYVLNPQNITISLGVLIS